MTDFPMAGATDVPLPPTTGSGFNWGGMGKALGAGSAMLGGILGASSIRKAASSEAKGLRQQAQSYFAASHEVARRSKYDRFRRDFFGAKTIGEQKAAMAEAGVDESLGTGIDIIAETMRELRIEKMIEWTNAKAEQKRMYDTGLELWKSAKNVERRGKHRAAGAIVGAIPQALAFMA